MHLLLSAPARVGVIQPETVQKYLYLTFCLVMPLMALVLGRLTGDFTNFGSIDNQQSSDEFMEQVENNACVHFATHE